MSHSHNGPPTRSLYIGAAGEHHIMAECFRNQIEAFKLPIDKGFDLVATTACRHFEGAAGVHADRPELPVYLQVKSTRVRVEAGSPEERPEARGHFPIKRADLELLRRAPNSALACVLFIDEDASLHLRGQRAYAWWHSSAELERLAGGGFFGIDPSSGDRVLLHFVFRDPARNSPDRQHTYLALTKDREQARLHGSGNFMVPPSQFDFSKLPSVAAQVDR